MSITAVIAKWKRPKELDEILSFLKTVPQITEIIVRDNTVENLMSYGKYVEAIKAKNETIYFQDDDCIVKNIRELIDVYDGSCLVNCLKKIRIKEYQYGHTMLGWGALFGKRWIRILDRYIETFGVDYCLKRESDRIFSALLGKHKTIVGEIVDFDSAHDKNIALWCQNDHETMKLEAIRKAKVIRDRTMNETNLTFAYWDKRYSEGGTSGSGSRGILAEYKAKVINDFIRANKVKSVIDYGCGDGYQQNLIQCDKYIGFDASPSAIAMCKKKSPAREFKHIYDYNKEQADLTLSLDVLYHLLEDHLYDFYLRRLFASSDKYVIIYSYNRESKRSDSQHLKCRRFTDWIEQNITDFTLIEHLKNPYYSLVGRDETESEFYIYKRKNYVVSRGRKGGTTTPLKYGMSIIISAWKTQKYIRACLDALENQTAFIDKNNFEVLLGIDNCQLVKEEAKKIRHHYRNLRVFWFDPKTFTYIIRTTLAYKAIYDRLLFCDSDDILYPDFVEQHLLYSQDADVVSQWVQEFKEKPDLPILNPRCIGGTWSIPTSIFRDEMGGFMPWPCEADTEFTQRARMRGYKYHVIESPLIHRRIHDLCLTLRPDTGMESDLRKRLHSIREERGINKVIEYVEPVFGENEELTYLP